MQRPTVIFLDAVGTLFGIRDSVGYLYSQLARQVGVEVSAIAVDQAFRKSFGASPPPTFTYLNANALLQQEYQWWKAIAASTFQQAGVLAQFADFDRFFEDLYHYFATPDPWVLYPEVLPTLQQCHNNAIQLGVLSNFDSRLHAVLQVLGLTEFFSSVTISTQVGAAKPDSGIFMAALQAHHCPAEAAWHVGDSYQEDYAGAQSAGLQGIWLKRPGETMPTRTDGHDREAALSIKSLDELTSLTSFARL